MRVRKFRKEDAGETSNIIRRCLREINSKDYSKKEIANLYNFFTPSLIIKNSKDRIVFVAVEGHRVVGTASLKENIVLTVFVNPDIHGKGIGSKLMDRVENLAKKKGYKTIKAPSSFTSFKFYKRRGYEKVKIIHSGENTDTIEMEKKL